MSKRPCSDESRPIPRCFGLGDKVRYKNGLEGQIVLIDEAYVSALIRVFDYRGASVLGVQIADLVHVDD